MVMERVVIVDDDEATLKLYCAVIKRVLGTMPVAFSDPRDALMELGALRPALIIVDYFMPEMDGIAFTRELRRIPEHAATPVLMLTAHDERTVALGAADAGATDVAQKPISLKDLAAHLRRYAPQSNVTVGEIVMPTDERDTIDRLHRLMRSCNPELAEHAEAVRIVALAIGEQLGLFDDDMAALNSVALVYDVGMLSVPDRVRAMPASLPMRWRSVVNCHVDAGASILGGSKRPLLQHAEQVARSHHERWDGKGYPEGLAGEAIPLLARVVAVADTYVALTSERPHRIEYTQFHALAQIRDERGHAFDPDVVDAFLRLENRLSEFSGIA
jgi:putative two-component system response regulator